MMRWLVVLCVVSGCSRASREGEAKQWAAPPPDKDIRIPTSLHIAIMVDGAARGALTADTLSGIKPGFADDEHKAWLIAALVPEARRSGSVVEVVSNAGITIKFTYPTPNGLEPAIFLTRRSDVIVVALDPRDPFPRYHGQGGQLRRAGDPMPHISEVARIEISRSTP